MKNLCNMQRASTRKIFEAGNHKMFADNNLTIFLFFNFYTIFYVNLNTISAGADTNVYDDV